MIKQAKRVWLTLLLLLMILVITAEIFNLGNFNLPVLKTPNMYINHINKITDIEQLKAETLKLYKSQLDNARETNENVTKISYALISAAILCFLASLKIIFSLFKTETKINK